MSVLFLHIYDIEKNLQSLCLINSLIPLNLNLQLTVAAELFKI